ncbi:hypothetical protein wTkk_000871 [Wolbachia endosymbiont of Trichogramma kaykai]
MMELLILNVLFATSEFLPEGRGIHCGFYNSFMGSWPNLYGISKSHAEKQGSEIKDLKLISQVTVWEEILLR